MFGEKEIRLEAYRLMGWIMDLEESLIVVEEQESLEENQDLDMHS